MDVSNFLALTPIYNKKESFPLLIKALSEAESTFPHPTWHLLPGRTAEQKW